MEDRLCSACVEESRKNRRVKWKKAQFTMSGVWHLYYRPSKGSARTGCGMRISH